MRTILAATIFLVAGVVNAQDYRNYYRDNDSYELNRSLDNIAWEVRMLRYDVEDGYVPSYGSYFPVYQQPVSKAYQKKLAKYQTRLRRAQENRANKAAEYRLRKDRAKRFEP